MYNTGEDFFQYISMVLNIIQWNMNGYQNNLHELQLIINNSSPDVIALQEIHLKNNSIKIQNYDFYVQNTNCNRAKFGVAILVKKSLQHSHTTSI